MERDSGEKGRGRKKEDEEVMDEDRGKIGRGKKRLINRGKGKERE